MARSCERNLKFQFLDLGCFSSFSSFLFHLSRRLLFHLSRRLVRHSVLTMLVSSSSAIPDRPPQQRQTSFKFLAGKIKTRTNEVLQRGKVGVNSASAMVEAIAAHPPNTGDGLTEREAKALSDKPLQQQGLLGTMMAQAQNGTLASDASTLLAVLKSATGREIDDREMLLERIVTMLQSLPADSKLQSTMTEGLLEMLWNDLPHPVRYIDLYL